MAGSWGDKAAKGFVRAADGTITTFRVPHQGADAGIPVGGTPNCCYTHRR